MTLRTCFATLCCILMLPLLVTAEPTSYLPVEHRAYPFLERLESHGWITKAFLGAKPLTRNAVATLLKEAGAFRDSLSEIDREEYDLLVREFGIEGWGSDAPEKGRLESLRGHLGKRVYSNGRNLLSTKGDEYTLAFDPIVIREASVGELHETGAVDRVYTVTNGFRVFGSAGNHLGFFVDIRDATESGTRFYPKSTATTMPGIGFAAFKEDRAEFDETNAHIAISGGPFTVSGGRGNVSWGRGVTGTLLLSDYAAPMDFLQMEARFWRLRFTALTAQLTQYPPIARWYSNYPAGMPQDSVTVAKYLTGHRVDIDISDKFSIGLMEMVIFGGRQEWSYYNPVMFLRSAEHSGGDHDNAAMGVDARWLFLPGWSAWGELLIDDITTTKLGTDWYGNKLAWQTGITAVDPFGSSDTDFSAEYTRIAPWVYTHRLPINSYTHYGDVLGHPSGPNSDVLALEATKRFTRRCSVTLAATQRRHGANPSDRNVGGDPLVGFKKGDSEHARFLAGDRETLRAISADISYELFWQTFVRLGATYESLNGDGRPLYRFSFALNE